MNRAGASDASAFAFLIFHRQRLDPVRHLQVLLCYAAGVMGGEHECHAVVGDSDIWVMTFLFSNFRHFVHENHGIDEF